jgi:hypothetical protein
VLEQVSLWKTIRAMTELRKSRSSLGGFWNVNSGELDSIFYPVYHFLLASSFRSI